MDSNVVKINPNAIDEVIIKKAIDLLKNNEIIAFPTDTVYGVGGNIFSQEAIKRIYSLKNRPQNKPINALISSLEHLEMIVEEIPQIFQELIKKFWPGPLTIIFKKKEEISGKVTGGLDTIGVR
ncbi:MAG: L-threonylcarbamoyladenylate synthase, partial [Candidatus Heimdallarchaeota archaeon]|nr:L-threonylcarbamoyladenylate synthase [Candidatus Heimdallarchaeota archaeon]